ncbi:pentapeptide repeat-containing protein (plasmid) [Scytonema sp. HK-05]|nr:pentapeptide repeat-containing protein [Scytonema sp. HK-05]
MFKLFAVKGVECVLLNACYSEEQAQAISQYIKYVIGMNQAIGDKAAIAFAVAFYDALGAGEEVQFAYNLGCAVLVGLKQDQTPVLKVTSIHPSDIQFVAGDIPPNPYQGLSAFGEKDAAFFFGREKSTDALFQMTHQQPLVAVIGASGSGKSSVVFAGLIPRLRSEGIWLISSFRPKSQPFDELALTLVRQLEPNLDNVEKVIKIGKLAESLKKGEVKLHQVASQILENQPQKRFLLVVDQFEELYTQCQDKEEQQRFIDTLLLAINQKNITLVFTLRADFYGYVLSYRPFGEALEKFGHKPLTLMSREELQTAIEQPAQKLSVQLQTHLAERILDDVGQEPGNLPLLEFALTQLWSKQNNSELTHKAYDEIGGVKQALIKHSEQVYLKLNDSQKQQAQRIFLSLVRLGEGTEDTRRVATREEIGHQNWDLVIDLAGSSTRLVVTGRNDKSGEETVEVVHEALIREWARLRQWVNENRERLIQKRKIEAAAVEWRNKGKSKDDLLLGKQLNEAKAFQKEQNISLALSDLAGEFIVKSIKYRRSSRLKFVGFVFIPIVALAVFLGFTAQRQMEIDRYWKTVENAKEQKDSRARIAALQELVKLGVSLNNIQLASFNLERANLQSANLQGANLQRADLQGADLQGADLQDANLLGANLQDAYLQDANLYGADLQYANLQGAYLQRANLERAYLQRANLQGAILQRADLQDANLLGAILQYANLQSANLQSAILQSADLQSAYLQGANLQGAYLRSASLQTADLQSADLQSADLQDANLQGADLQGAKLQDANLLGAKLQDADLKGAKLGCVKRYENEIVCTNLRNIKNLTPEQVKQADNWEQATYDPEFRKKLGLPNSK